MTQDRPDILEILATVAEFARGVASNSEGGERYDALCAAFLLEVARRELIKGDAPALRQRGRLAALTGVPALAGNPYANFCKLVRAGRLDSEWTQVFDFALAQVIDKVAVTNPDYLAPMHREQKPARESLASDSADSADL